VVVRGPSSLVLGVSSYLIESLLYTQPFVSGPSDRNISSQVTVHSSETTPSATSQLGSIFLDNIALKPPQIQARPPLLAGGVSVLLEGLVPDSKRRRYNCCASGASKHRVAV